MIESEQDRLDMLEDYGADITLPDASVIKGIFDREFAAVQFGGDLGVESYDPVALVSTAQASALAEDSAITVSNSGITGVDGNYLVREPQPDGTGLTLLKLKVA